MPREEAIANYLAKKQSEGLSNSAIRTALKKQHQFSEEEIREIMTEISDRELEAVQAKGNTPLAFLEHRYVSWFFILFAAVVIVISLKYTQQETTGRLQQFLPWFMICAAVFIICKHAYRLFKGKNPQ